jgi:Flp pilus assembly protein TadD
MSQIEDLVDKGNRFLEAGKFEEALGFFDQALLLNQNDPELWNHKGVALRSMGRYNEAMECFNKSLELDPRDKKAS